jgi:ABC-2 type transport system permease protein
VSAMREAGQGFVRQLGSLAKERRLRLLMLLFLASAFVGMDVYRHLVLQAVPIAVLDLDNSKLSRTLHNYLAASPELALSSRPPATPEVAEELVTRGELAAFIVIPERFSAEIKRGRKGQVLVGVDMSNILIGKIAYKAISRAFTTVAGGVELVFLEKLGEPSGRALARVLPITIDEVSSFNAGNNYAVYLAPGLVFFFLNIFLIILGFATLLGPRASDPPREALGRQLANAAVGLAAALLLFYLFLPHVEIVPQVGPQVVLLVSLLFVLADLLMVGAFAVVIPSRLFAFQVALLLGMLSLMMSGLTWPSDAFPRPLFALAQLFPLTPFARAFRMFLHEPVSLADLRAPLLALGSQALGYAGAILIGLRLRRLAC